MHWPVCNSTLEAEKITETPLWKGLDFHQFALILAAAFGLFSIVVSFYLIFRHATHYLKPWEQRHVIRVLFMVPIYSSVSFLSIYFYVHAVYFEVLGDCYEAFAIASFFALLCHYIAPDLHNQKDYFRSLRPKGWVLPVSWFKRCCGGEQGMWRTPRSGLTWFNIIWLGVFQYCFIRVTMTIVSVITQAAGRYCLESLNPAFAHVWVMVIEGACVTVAMFCLIQFYYQLHDDLTDHKPLLKIIAIKLVIFLSFWQTILISFLTSAGAITTSPHLDTPDIKVGMPNLLLCIEMALFSILHLFAFPWKEYDVRRSSIVAAESGPSFALDPKTAYHGGPLGAKALLDAFNPWDLVKAVGRGFRWFAVGRKTREQDISYKTNVAAAAGTGLEPARGEREYYGGRLAEPGFRGAKPGPYRPLRDDADDEQELLARAQPDPYSDPDPHSRFGADGAGDIGAMGSFAGGLYDRASSSDHFRATHPTPGTVRRTQQQQEVVGGGVEERPGLGVEEEEEDEDTAYHGAAVTPAPEVLRPGGRDWDTWGRGGGEVDEENMF